MGLAAGADLIYKTLIRFGFGEKTGIDFPGEISGLVYKSENWTQHFLANVCFGYGIAVTGLQIARAYGAIANDGELLKPYFAEKEIAQDGKEHILNSKKVDREILDKKTCDILNDIFQNVVHEGTAQKAANQVCTIAGKTGTALRTSKTGRGYDPRRSLASFVGYFPAVNPRFVGIVMFDEPKTSIYGGEVSAPVFTNIAKRFVSLPRNNELADVPPKEKQEESEPERVSLAQTDDFAEAEIKYATATEVHEYCDSANALPDFRGKTIRDAYRLACSLKMKCEIYGSGVVENQQPDPGTVLDQVNQIILYGE
jgi:cell division protein FtsI (penicillin-binding protein 3)